MSHQEINVWPGIENTGIRLKNYASKFTQIFQYVFCVSKSRKKLLKILHKTKIKQKSALVGLAKKSTERSTEKNFKNNDLKVSIIFFSMKIHVYPE